MLECRLHLKELALNMPKEWTHQASTDSLHLNWFSERFYVTRCSKLELLMLSLKHTVSSDVFVFPSPGAPYIALPECWPELYVTHLVALSSSGCCVWNLCYTNLHTWLLLKSLHRLTTAHTSSETLIKMSTRSEPNFSLFQHSMHIYATIEESARGAAPGSLPKELWGQPCPASSLQTGPWFGRQAVGLAARPGAGADRAMVHSSPSTVAGTLPGCDAHVGNECTQHVPAQPHRRETARLVLGLTGLL